MSRASSAPSRIVCLSAESADILSRLGAADRLVGVSAYAPLSKALRRVPRVSGFSAANVGRILALKPDLVIGYSDVQAGIAAALIKGGVNVLVTQQISLREIEETILLFGRIVGKEARARTLVRQFRTALKPRSTRRLRVYFEEWPEPMISGIGWVSELIERAGGDDIFAELRDRRRASERVVSAEEVVRRNPQVIIGSWCGKKVRIDEIRRRPGWQTIDAVRQRRLYEMDSNIILQPGPKLTEGYRELCRILDSVSLR
jgi:iron complex transport system substrate-binding protein